MRRCAVEVLVLSQSCDDSKGPASALWHRGILTLPAKSGSTRRSAMGPLVQPRNAVDDVLRERLAVPNVNLKGQGGR